MLEWLKSMWAKYKVHVSVVGGALIVATAYGQCTFEPDVEAIEEAVEEEAGEGANNMSSEIPVVVPVMYVEENTVSNKSPATSKAVDLVVTDPAEPVEASAGSAEIK